MEQTIGERITRARTRLLLDHQWFGSLALRLVVVETDAAPTIQTDGTTLEYNPTWCAQWSDEQLMGLVAHEVMHCAALHPYRMESRDPVIWNIAADIAINQLIRADGIELPPTELASREAEFDNCNVEFIYAKLLDEQQKGKDQGKPDYGEHVKQAKGPAEKGSAAEEAKSQPGPKSGSQQPADAKEEPGSGPEQMTEFDWQIEAEAAAMVARKAGSMPGGADLLIKQTREAKIDWVSVLRRFIENVVPQDYSWVHPDRRHIANGTYLPGVVKENLARIVLAMDTSGSTYDLLPQFRGEFIDMVREARPAEIIVIQCDAAIHSVETFTPDDIDLEVPFKGGGGTRFQPVFDWLAEQDEPIAALIYMTDLECFDQPEEPDIPVLWVAPETATREQTFGEVIHIPGLH